MRELAAAVSSKELLEMIERQIELEATSGKTITEYLVDHNFTDNDVIYCIDKLIDAGYFATEHEASAFKCKLIITW